MAKTGLSNALLGKQVLPQSFMVSGWFGVTEFFKSCVAEGEAKGYVRLPDALPVESDRGKYHIHKAAIYENGDLKPGKIVAAWTEEGSTKVAVTSYDGAVKEFFLTHLRIVGDGDAAK